MLQYFARVLKGKIQNNILHLPAGIGNGFLKLHKLPDGLQAIISNYAVKQDNLFNRTKINTDFYTLRFDEVVNVGDIIKRYLSLKMSLFNYEPMDIEYKRILAEIVQTDADPLFETLLIQNRVVLLLERFFIRIFYKIQSSEF